VGRGELVVQLYRCPRWTVYGLWADSLTTPLAKFVGYGEVPMLRNTVRSVQRTLVKP
jgi:hypothetical protein